MQFLSLDIMGPYPVCEDSNNRFILTVIDLCTHYPFAFGLRHHTAKDVADCLIKIFCQWGFCSALLSDLETELNYKFMKELVSYFQIYINTSI